MPGSLASRRDTAAPERAAGAGDGHDPARAHAVNPASCEQVPAVDGEDGAGDERRGVRRQELVGAGEIGRRSPPAQRGVPGDGLGQVGACASTPRPAASRTSRAPRR